MKVFSLIAIYNQFRFEKELDASLADDPNKKEDDLQQPLNPYDEYAVDKSSQLFKTQAEI